MQSLTDDRPDFEGMRDHLTTVKILLPYLWPKNAQEMRIRVVVALIFLIAAKAITVAVLSSTRLLLMRSPTQETPSSSCRYSCLLPMGCPGAGSDIRRIRDAVFAKVAQRAIREAGLRTFRHLHKLAMRFHLDRQTGGLSRAVERVLKASISC